MNIKTYRKQIGMTQEELAGKLGVKQYVIAKYENGIHSPTPERIVMISKALGVTVNEIYGEKSPAKPTVSMPSKKTRVGKISEIFEKLAPVDQRAILKQARGLLK